LKSKTLFIKTQTETIPKNWVLVELQQISRIIDSLHVTPKYSSKGISMVRSTDIKSGNLNIKNTFYVSEDVYKKFTKNHKPRRNDIVMSRVGTYFPNSFVETDQPFCLGQNTLVIHPLITSRFLYYALNSKLIQGQIDELLVGSGGQKTISLEDIRELLILKPKDPNEIESISKTLSDLDSKIQNLQKQNETLEQMAQAIFKSWFVDFDGVTEFEDSELEKIPKGWSVNILDSIANNVRNTIKSKDITPDIFYIGLEHMPRDNVGLDTWENSHKLKSNKFKFETNQILFGKLRPYFKKVGISPINGICSTDILVLNSKDTSWLEFLLFTVSSYDFIEYSSQSTTGTKMPRTDWDYMKKYKIILPPLTKVLKFHAIIKKSIEMMRKNIFEIKTLTKTRDALLPKLMSGEIRV